MYPMNRMFIFAFGALAFWAQNALGQTAPVFLTTDDDLRLYVPLGVESPVIELTYVGGFIDSDDRIQTRVFVEGDASAPRYILEVYRPAYMKETGTFRSELTEDEFNRLLRSFGSESVLSVPQEELSNNVRAGVVATQEPSLTDVGTHDARVQIDFRLSSQTGAGSATQPDLRSLAMPTSALEVAARAKPAVMRNIASGVLALEGLVRLKTLERVD